MVHGIEDNQAFLCCAESKALKWIGRKRCFLKIPFQPSSIFVLAQKNKDNNKASFWHPPLPSLHPCPPQKRPKSRQEMPNNAPKLERGHRRFIFTALWQRCSQSSGKYTKRRWPGQEHIEANWSASTCAPYGSSERLENFVASSESGPGIILNQVYPKNQ